MLRQQALATLQHKEKRDYSNRQVRMFSSSQLDAYVRCSAAYYFGWIKRTTNGNGKVSSPLAFDRCLKATVYAHCGYEPDRSIPFEEKWKPELDIAADVLSEGCKLNEVFTETFNWLCSEFKIEWSNEQEEGEMLQQGSILASQFYEEFRQLEATPLVAIRAPMIDKTTGLVVSTNGTPVPVKCTLDLVSSDGIIFKLKTSSRAIEKIEYDWTLDLQRFVFEQTKGQSPKGLKVVNMVRRTSPMMQVIDAPEPRISRTLAICQSVLTAINLGAFFPNPKNTFGCSKAPAPCQLTPTTG